MPQMVPKVRTFVPLPLNRFYQFGYVTPDIETAIVRLGERFGVTEYRRKRANDWMQSAHAWAGETMIEILELGEGAPALYTDWLPPEGCAARLHHLGYRVHPDQWTDLLATIDHLGIGTDMIGTVMDGHLRYAYADTRDDLGVYTEFVGLSGPCLKIYDDVPHN